MPYRELDLCKNYILKDLDYIDRFCINFFCHCVLEQVPQDTNLFDYVVLWKEVVQPTKKSRSVGPHKSEPEKTTSKKENRIEKQEIQECEYIDT